MGYTTQLSIGSQGDDVKKLQQTLVDKGFLKQSDVDGIIGKRTEMAIKNYQGSVGLERDGIVGDKTYAALYGNSGSTNKTTTPTVTDDAQLAQKPGAYQFQWQTQLNDTIKKILNREEFTFDLNGDALYNQYKDSATRQGKLAMEDAIGMASAMTGGYGNSYAQSVGQQAFNQQLEGLNDVIPEVYQLARDKYDKDTQKLLNDYAILSAEEEKKYNRKIAEEEKEYNREKAETPEEGLSDDQKWLMDFSLEALKNGYSYNPETGGFAPVEEPKEDYKGRFSALTSPEEIIAVLDSYDLLVAEMPVFKSMGVNTVGEGRALALIYLFNTGEINSEDLDFLAQKYNLSEAEMDKALEVYNKKA